MHSTTVKILYCEVIKSNRSVVKNENITKELNIIVILEINGSSCNGWRDTLWRCGCVM
jgi:hypothetical protein